MISKRGPVSAADKLKKGIIIFLTALFVLSFLGAIVNSKKVSAQSQLTNPSSSIDLFGGLEEEGPAEGESEPITSQPSSPSEEISDMDTSILPKNFQDLKQELDNGYFYLDEQHKACLSTEVCGESGTVYVPTNTKPSYFTGGSEIEDLNIMKSKLEEMKKIAEGLTDAQKNIANKVIAQEEVRIREIESKIKIEGELENTGKYGVVKKSDSGVCEDDDIINSYTTLDFVTGSTFTKMYCFLLKKISNGITFLLGLVTDTLLRDVLEIKGVIGNQTVITVWTTIRNIINSIFVISFLIMILLNVLRVDIKTWQIQRMVPVIVGAILLVNFSMFIANFLLLFFNAITKTFLGLMTAEFFGVGGAGTFSIGGLSPGIATLKILVGVAYVLILLYLYLVLWLRVVLLNFLVMVSAIPYIAMALPFPQVKKLVGEWWGWFFNWAFMGPLVALLLYIAAVAIGSVGAASITPEKVIEGEEEIFKEQTIPAQPSSQTPIQTPKPVAYDKKSKYNLLFSDASFDNLKLKISASVCGDAIVDVGEECDDGNLTSGDGCSASCKTEAAPGSQAQSTTSFPVNFLNLILATIILYIAATQPLKMGGAIMKNVTGFVAGYTSKPAKKWAGKKVGEKVGRGGKKIAAKAGKAVYGLGARKDILGSIARFGIKRAGAGERTLKKAEEKRKEAKEEYEKKFQVFTEGEIGDTAKEKMKDKSSSRLTEIILDQKASDLDRLAAAKMLQDRAKGEYGNSEKQKGANEEIKKLSGMGLTDKIGNAFDSNTKVNTDLRGELEKLPANIEQALFRSNFDPKANPLEYRLDVQKNLFKKSADEVSKMNLSNFKKEDFRDLEDIRVAISLTPEINRTPEQRQAFANAGKLVQMREANIRVNMAKAVAGDIENPTIMGMSNIQGDLDRYSAEVDGNMQEILRAVRDKNNPNVEEFDKVFEEAKKHFSDYKVAESPADDRGKRAMMGEILKRAEFKKDMAELAKRDKKQFDRIAGIKEKK